MSINIRIVTFLLVNLLIVSSYSQSSSLKKAGSNFKKGEYFVALQAYKEAIAAGDEINAEAKKNIAICYYNLNNIDDAFTAFQEIAGDLHGEDLFIYANTAHKFGFYDGAIELYEQARKEGVNPVKINELISSCRWAMENNLYVDYLVNPSTLLTFGQSFGITFYKEGVVYSSAPEDAANKKLDKQGKAILSLYYSGIQNNEIVAGTTKLFSKNLEFPEHIGAISFSPDNKKMYYSRAVYVKGGESVIKIFSVDYDGKEWVNIQELSFNSDEFSCAHPAVSPDNKYLYFTSTMKGGYGGKDLYYVEILGGSRVGTPINLGSEVNTYGDEVYPFISSDNTLYFSSDGHFGFGGWDLFKARNVSGKWTEVSNMMQPFNSNKDDFGYVIDPKNSEQAFLSSNRVGTGENDIIFYVLPKNQVKKEDETTNVPIAGAEILKQEVVAEPAPVVETVVTPVVPVVVPIIAAVGNDYPSLFSAPITSNYNGSPIAGVKVVIKDANTGEIVMQGVTDASGRANVSIPEKFRKKDQEFDISFTKDGEFNTKNMIVNIGEIEDLNKTGVALTPIFKDPILNEISGMVIPHDGNQITAEGYVIMDKIAAYMLQNNNIVIKLNGHTDARNQKPFNLTNSMRLAEVAEKYLISKGVPDQNIIPRGYGERYVLNKCKRGILCDESMHTKNKRIEVVVWRKL